MWCLGLVYVGCSQEMIAENVPGTGRSVKLMALTTEILVWKCVALGLNIENIDSQLQFMSVGLCDGNGHVKMKMTGCVKTCHKICTKMRAKLEQFRPTLKAKMNIILFFK